jgi:hypothetical protein
MTRAADERTPAKAAPAAAVARPRPDLSPSSPPAEPEPRKVKPRGGGRRVMFTLVGVATLLSLFLVRGLWGPGNVPGDDTLAHLLQARLTAEDLLPGGRLDGWQPNVGLGYQQFLFLGMGLSWLVVAIHWLSFGLLSVAGAFKVAVVLSYALLPLATAFLARSFGLGYRAAGVAAILALAVSSPFGGAGLTGAFLVGLLGHQLGALGFVVAFGGALRVIADGRARWVVLTAVAFALLCVTHAISCIVLAAFLVIVLPFGLVARGVPRVRPMLRLAFAFVLGAALAAFWMVPAFVHGDLRGILTSWENPPLAKRLADIISGQLLFPGTAGIWLLLAGWLFTVRTMAGRSRWAVGLVVAPFAYLYVADSFLRWNPTNLVSLQLANRGLGYVGLLAVLPLAALLGHIPRGGGVVRRVYPVVAVLVAVAWVLSSTWTFQPKDQQASADLRELAGRIEAEVPPSARFAVQPDFAGYQRTGVSRPAFWLAFQAHRNTANIFNVESSHVSGDLAYLPDNMLKLAPVDAADQLARAGISHVVLTDETKAAAWLSSPRFRPVWQRSPMALLAVVQRDGQPEPGALVSGPTPLQAKMLKWGSQRFSVQVSSAGPVIATVATAWSPKWHATVNGQVEPVTSTEDGLISVELPAGNSTLELSFARDAWDWTGLGITLLVLAGLLGWAWRRRRRRKRNAGEPESATLDEPAPAGR